jgi:hypothetical protein
MVRVETLQKHVNFLRDLQKGIKNNKGLISLSDYAKTYHIGHGYIQIYKEVGLINKIRAGKFEINAKTIEPIIIRKILETKNEEVTAIRNKSIKNFEKNLSKPTPKSKVKKNITQAPKKTKVEIQSKKSVNVQKIGIIRSFIKWLW